MTIKASKFGSKCELNKKFLKELLKTDLVEQIILNAELKANAKMKKVLKGVKKSKILGLKSLEDANNAGTSKSNKCLLILTEGESAKSLAMAGLEIVGRDNFGIFPLKGKLLNVRDSSISKIMNNEEIQNIIKIMGLKIGEEYKNLNSLRYGGIMIMTDQDVDGSHIKGLIINFIAHFWPILIKNFDFITQFVTPIIKCFNKEKIKSFFTLNDYKEWS